MDKEQEIYDALVDKNINDVEEILKGFGDEVEFIDEKIDDGCDEGEEDDYVLMRSYQVDKMYVRIYFGDNTRLIGNVELQED